MRERYECRLCDGELKPVFALKPSPIANSFPALPDSGAPRYPLELVECVECGHVQQRYVAEGLYEDYKYQTPQTVERYLAPEARAIADRHPSARVLEIGCNNGVFLDLLIAEGLEVLGVDPAATHPRALPTHFSWQLALELGEFDVIVANNVLAHIDDLDSVFHGIRKCLRPDGELIFEVQYLVDLVKSGKFDMIYHEHMDYHHLRPLQGYLRRFGLVMTKWEHIPQHGGSIRVYASKVGVECELPEEQIDWDAFRAKVEAARIRLGAILRSHGQVVAFGAPAKAATIIGEFGLEPYISYVVDDTPLKQGRYIPGTNLKILPTSEVGDGPVLLLAWNFADEISRKIPNKLILPYEDRDYRA